MPDTRKPNVESMTRKMEHELRMQSRKKRIFYGDPLGTTSTSMPRFLSHLNSLPFISPMAGVSVWQ